MSVIRVYNRVIYNLTNYDSIYINQPPGKLPELVLCKNAETYHRITFETRDELDKELQSIQKALEDYYKKD
jgi:hypothetical protein